MTTIAEARLSFEATIARLQEEIAEIDAWLIEHPHVAYGADFTVALRMVFRGERSTPSALRQVGEGYNFNGTTPATVYAMTYNNAYANAQRFNANARRENKDDVEYSVIGLRSFFMKQRQAKADTLANMVEMLAKAPAA